MSTELNDATTTPPEGVMLSTPGEFAAMWNSHTEEQRAYLLKNIQSASSEGRKCFMEDHVAELAQLRAKPRFTEVELNVFAQYLYESIGDADNIHLMMNMTDKASFVAALEIAIERMAS